LKIPVWLATVLATAVIASQGWLILAVIDLKTDMAAVKATLSDQKPHPQIAKNKI
jgi:hypothetical protein